MKKFIAGMLLILVFSALAYGAQQDESDLISLDFKGMDIRDVLKILSQKSGLNIVADNDIKGAVTVYIKDVSVMSALDIIASINNLAYEQDGTLIRVMRDVEYEKNYGSKFKDKARTEVIKLNYANASEIAKVAGEMRASKGKVIADDASNTIVLIDIPENITKMKSVILAMDAPLFTEVFSLDYAKAELIKDKIEQMISKGIGSMKFDERTNKVVVKDTPQKIEDIRKVIQAFDEKTREVVIEANIIEVTLSDKYSYGIDWMDIAKLGNVKLTADTNLSTGISGTSNTLTVATVGGNYTEVINLLKTFGKTNVLSRPRITAIDKQEAKILVGSKEVYVTSTNTTTDGGTVTVSDNVQFVDVGVSLTVTPNINKMGFVTLKIKPEVSSTSTPVELLNKDGTVRSRIPTVATSQAETTVLVKDNTTIIIGGLMKDTMIDNRQKIPFLGDVPLVGKLFSATGKSKVKTEIVVFLTPRIIEGDSTTEEAKKYMADWEKKSEEMQIEEPKEPKFDLFKAMPEKKEPVKTYVTTKKYAANLKKEQPEQKWTPLLGAKSRDEVEDAEKLKAEDSAEPSITSRTPYEEYYFKIRQEINNIAKQDLDVSGINGDVELQFTLDKEGFLIRGPVILNNPDLRLMRSAVKTVKKASPFLRFPEALKKNQADFNVVIRY